MSNYSESGQFNNNDDDSLSLSQQQQQQQQSEQQLNDVNNNEQELDHSFIPTFGKNEFNQLSNPDTTQDDDVSIIEAVAAVAAAMNTDNNMMINNNNNQQKHHQHHQQLNNNNLNTPNTTNNNTNFNENGLNFNNSNETSILSETTDPMDEDENENENQNLNQHQHQHLHEPENDGLIIINNESINFNDLEKQTPMIDENNHHNNLKSKTIKFTPNKTSENIRKPHLYITNPTNKKAKKDNTKGPPKNSRFFRVYNLDGQNKTSKSSSIHHYNPYRYPQNRSKLNPHPDFIKSKRLNKSKVDKLGNIINIDTTKNPFYSIQSEVNDNVVYNTSTSSPTKPVKVDKYDPTESEIPIFKPSLEEFEDIYNYINSIKDIGKKYGAIKIIPPDEFIPKLSINLESFWIKSSRQSWRSPADELNTRCEFYNQLREYLKSNSKINLNKLPCIDKRAIDLYRLFCVVGLRGGFQTCCNEKLWAQIGRELGFYGKISSSLSSSIKSVYQKYLSGWEKIYKDKQEHDFLNLSRNDEKHSLFPKSDTDLSQSLNKLNDKINIIRKSLKKEDPITIITEDRTLIKKDVNTEGSSETTSETITNSKLPNESIPMILGSSSTYLRNRNTLTDLGFTTYFDQSTTHKKGITLNTLQTLPGYDFYNWIDSNKIDDIPPTELKISSLYTLKQFNDKSRILKNQVLNKFYPQDHYYYENLNYLENKYWELLENSNIIFETEVSFNQFTNIHDSCSENKFLSDKYNVLNDSKPGPLNFNNSTITDGSMLQFINSDSDTIFHSKLNFAMFFGTKSWNIEDHWLYNMDYHYLGDAKSVYVIPPEFQNKFEELIKENYNKIKNESRRTEIAMKLFEDNISNSDIYNSSIENGVSFDLKINRSKPHDINFSKLNYFNDDSIIKFNNDLMFTPKYLKKHGIPVYHTYQEVGEMLIKFPKSYSSFFSVGTSVTSSVNIAPLDWLNESMEINKWFQKQQIIPNFSLFTMLLITARESKDIKVLSNIEPILNQLVDKEIDKRNKLRQYISEYSCNSDYNVINKLDEVKLKYDLINGFNDENENLKLVEVKSEIKENNDDFNDVFDISNYNNDANNSNNEVTDNNIVVKAETIEDDDTDYVEEPVTDTSETIGSEMFTTLSRWNKFTDSDLVDIFPSFILIKNMKNKRSTFTMSLELFIEMNEKSLFKSDEFEYSLITLVNDEYLKESLEILKSRFVNIETWSIKYHEIIEKNGKPTIEEMRPILDLGYFLFDSNNFKTDASIEYYSKYIEEFKQFEKEFKKTENWVKKVKTFFNIKECNSIPLLEFEDFVKLIEEIPQLMITCKEINEVIEIGENMKDFDFKAKDLLNKYSKENDIPMNELEILYNIGSKLNVKLETFKKIDILIKQKKWTMKLENKINSLSELKQLYEDGKVLVLMIKNVNKIQEYEINIEILKDKIERCNNVIEQFKEIEKDDRLTSIEELIKLKHLCKELPIIDTLKNIEKLISLMTKVERMVPEIIEMIENKNKYIEDDNIKFEIRLEEYLRVMKKSKDIFQDNDIETNLFNKILQKSGKYHQYYEIIDKQIIQSSFQNIRYETNEFNSIIRISEKGYYNEFDKFDEVKGIKYFINYNLDVLNCNDDRYCVCKQTYEGDMVECEICKQWYHFNCIGYVNNNKEKEIENGNEKENEKENENQDIHNNNNINTITTNNNITNNNNNNNNNTGDGKFLCPLCDFECKLDTSKKFYDNINKRVTFESMVLYAKKIMRDTCKLKASGLAFLAMVGEFYRFYYSVIEFGIVEKVEKIEDEDGNSDKLVCNSDNVQQLHQLLERLNGCLFRYVELGDVLQKRYVYLQKQHQKSV